MLENPYYYNEDAKAERGILRKLWLAFCGLCALALFLAALEARSATDVPLHVLEKDGVTIHLLDKPCVEPVSIGLIRPDVLGRFKALDSVWPEKDGSKKSYAGCWAALTAEEAMGVESFLVVFSDGESAAIPRSEFRKVKGQVGA